MERIDLHVHSTESDGSFTPTELVTHALEKGLVAMALTDHDTTSGLAEAISAAKDSPLEIVSGIEFSTQYDQLEIHILGLDLAYDNPSFQEQIIKFQNQREKRNEQMCEKLQAQGISITYEKLLASSPYAVITRSHFATYLLEHKYVNSSKEAFERYIGDHARCFVPRKKASPKEAIDLILEANGIPILAHPLLYHISTKNLTNLVGNLKQSGLVGIEAIYSSHSPSQEREVRALAKEFDLKISGGSDFHGLAKPNLDLGTGYGNLFIPSTVLQDLRNS